MAVLHGQNSARISHGSAGLASSGELPSRAAAGKSLPVIPAAAVAAMALSRPIQNPRPGLDQKYPFVQNLPIAIQRPKCEDTASARLFC